ncbi:MAG: hypothetical protein J6Y37_08685 [Paludibacteraceae bacterium]|nr:hypothetical protein [Paludibacteraceae bacterium]
MTKKLIYSFYISEPTYHLKINDIHFRCLERYKDSFDCVDITFILEDRVTCMVYAMQAQHKFLDIFAGKDIQFSLIDNNEFRESYVFYHKVATKLDDNELVFFAHNKGVSNIGTYDERQIYTWVCGMYYYSLNFMDEVNYKLVGRKFYSYGSFLTKNYEPEHPNKYGWYYIGTFFWINCVKLRYYMYSQGIKVPEMGDRFYDEEFLGNIIDAFPLIMAGCHEEKYLMDCYNYYESATEFMKLIYDTKADGFDDFYNEMTA